MAGEKLTWAFELLDKMSGPLGRINKALDKVAPAMKATSGQASAFAKITQFLGRNFGDKAAAGFVNMASGIAKVGQTLQPVTSKIGSVASSGLTAVGGAMAAVATAAAAAVAGLAIAGGKFAIDSIAFKETTLASLEAILKSKQAAEDVFNKATKFAAKTPFSTSQVAAAFEALVASGTQVKDLEKTMQSLGDFAGTDVNKLERAISVIAQIRGKGKLQGEELMQLAEAGLPMGKVLDELAKKMGKTKDEVQALLSSGKINSEQGIGAILATIDGSFGGRMEKASNTLAGLWSTLKSIPEDILFNPAAAGAIEKMIGPIKEVIKAVSAALAPDSANGQRLIAMFGQIASAVGDLFSGIDAGGVMSTISAVLDEIQPRLAILIDFGRGLFSGLGDGFKAVAGVVRDFMGALSRDPATLQSLSTAFKQIGKAAGVVVGGLAAFIGAMTVLQAAIMGPVLGAIFDFIGDAWNALVGLFADLRDAAAPFVQKFSEAWAKLSASFAALWAKLEPGFAAIVKKLEPVIDGLKLVWDTLSGIAGEMFFDVLLSGLAVVGAAFMVLVGLILLVADAVDFVMSAFDSLAAFFGGLGDKISGMSWQEIGISIVKGIIDGILSMLSPAGSAMSLLGDSLMGPVKGIGTPAATNAAAVPAAPGLFGMPSAANAAAIPAGGDVATGPLGWFAGLGTPAAPPTNANGIQPAAASGPAPGVTPAAGPKDESIHVTIPQILIQMAAGDDPAAAGKQAADSFMGQLGSALKGFAGERGR